MARDSARRVAVLLATYQGEPFLAEQLDSIASSTGVDWFVRASDDHSTDRTREILEGHRERWGRDRLTIADGPGRGLSANFLSLVNDPSIEADAYAYADQDDVWEEGKLERASAWLWSVPPATPALYCGRTRLIDREGRTIGLSPEFKRPPSFANALTQNLASGNTMVFNHAALRLLQATAAAALASAVHDWWTYLIVSGVGGVVRYDPEPMVRYRQHGGNQIGGAVGVLERAWNARDLFAGRLSRWNDRNERALRDVRHLLTPANAAIFDAFAAARHASLVPRLVGVRRAGVYRQTRRGRVLMWTAAILNRL